VKKPLPFSVALVADNASTVFGGEAIIPYHYFRLLSEQGIEVWLIVHARCKEEMTHLLPYKTDRMIFIADSGIESAIFKLETLPFLKHFRDALSHFRELIFHYRQSQVVKKLIRAKKIDLVHQPIPVSPKQPSFLYGLKIPLIIGPMNGGMEPPTGIRDFQSNLTRFGKYIGRKLAIAMNSLIPGKKEANLLLVANQRTAKALPFRAKRLEKLVENGVDLTLIDPVIKSKDNNPITFIFVGRLIELKGVDYLIKAFQKIQSHFPCELQIIGEGPCQQALQELAHESSQIHLLGHLPWKETLAKLKKADVFVFPSLMECGGAAVLEAMASGLPVIAANWGGPADYLDPSCGILITPLNKEQFVEDLAKAMETLGKDSSAREKMGTAGYQRVQEEFNWNKKIEKIIHFYQEVLQE